MSLSLRIKDIGPVSELRGELPRLTVVYGRVGSGKSYIFRILTLLHLAHQLAELWGFRKGGREDYAKALARLVMLECGHFEEAFSVDPEVLRTQYVPHFLLKRGMERGTYEVLTSGNFLARLEVLKKGMDLELGDEFSEYVIVTIPQERNPVLIQRDLETFSARLRKLYERWGTSIPIRQQAYLALTSELMRRSPVYMHYLMNLLVATSFFLEEREVECIELGRDHRLKLLVHDIGEVLICDEYSTGSSYYDLETPLVLPQGAIDYLLLTLLLKALRKAAREVRGIKFFLVVDEFMAHADPLLTMKALDLVLEILYSEERISIVLVTHNPDVVSRLLNILQHSKEFRERLLNQVKFLYLEYLSEKQGVVGQFSGLKLEDNVVLPEREIPWLEEYTRKLTSPTEIPKVPS
ncbi:MAG: hypothetical protein DRJ40_01045 [Thermoprotei archaeon]|nr:MAG: hypothetical protein DRJ40_01045 [Thermoprotei archaeon]